LSRVDTGASLIVIVDDEESVRRALTRLILSAGFQARSFSGGKEFLDWVRANRADCVVLDLHMPTMNGFDVQTRLRTEPNRPPVVIITGHDAPESEQRALAAGAVAYLRKPVDEKVLLGAIAAAIPAKTAGGSA
jgi:FixJ family two-component response regulator